MSKVQADPESQEAIDDGTAKGGWTWPWIMALVLGLVAVVLVILWICGVFSSSSDLHNERIVVLPVAIETMNAADVEKLRKSIGSEYIPSNGNYLLINKADQGKVEAWAKDDMKFKADDMKDMIKPILEVHADEIKTAEQMGNVLIELAQRASVIVQHRARLAVKNLKLDKADELMKMAPKEEIDEAVKLLNKLKADLKCFVEDLLIPTAKKINIEVTIKDKDGKDEKKQVRDMMVEFMELAVAEGVPIAEKIIALAERFAKEAVGDEKTIADLLKDIKKGPTGEFAKRMEKMNKDKTYEADKKAIEEMGKAAGKKFEAVQKKHEATQAAFEGPGDDQMQQPMAAIHQTFVANMLALGETVKPVMTQFGVPERAFDAMMHEHLGAEDGPRRTTSGRFFQQMSGSMEHGFRGMGQAHMDELHHAVHARGHPECCQHEAHMAHMEAPPSPHRSRSPSPASGSGSEGKGRGKGHGRGGRAEHAEHAERRHD